MLAISQVEWLEQNINRILNPPEPPPPSQPVQAQTPGPTPIAKTVVASPASTNAQEIVTNVLVVGKFLAIPAEKLIDLEGSERIEFVQVTVTAHYWFEGKLLLDYEYYAGTQWLDEKGKVLGGRNPHGSAIAILDPALEHWDVIGCPEVDITVQNSLYHRSVLLHGELFNCDGGQIKKFDFQNRQWMILKISDGNNYELFAANGHLYAASRDIIFEISDGGKSTQILASTRRNPPVTALDREDLGTPILLTGPEQSLRVVAKNK